MAQIVAGLATPHGPQMSTHWSKWSDFEQRDRNHPQLLAEPPVTFDELVARAPVGLQEKLTEEAWQDEFDRAQAGLGVITDVLKEAPTSSSALATTSTSTCSTTTCRSSASTTATLSPT